MKNLLPLLALYIFTIAPAMAADDAVVVREAVVHAKANGTSSRVGKLGAGTRVSVFSRRGGWKEVFAEQKSITGWVRGYQVREGEFVAQVSSDDQADSRGFLSGLAAFSRKASSFFSRSSSSTSAGTATIGVRGLSEQEIKTAVADFGELEKMKTFASDRKRAKKFARKGKLEKRKVPHIAGKKQ